MTNSENVSPGSMQREEKVCTVKTKSGILRGICEEGYLCFRGIPYGHAERFKAPETAIWDKELDCTVFGKKAIQVFDIPRPWIKELPKREEFSEDCLNLNIYVPAQEQADIPESGLPVLVEIHGGSFQNGSNQGRSPQRVIRDHSFIYVAINYRLGALGFLPLEGMLGEEYRGSGNCGILDQLCALKWIHENIEAFGGNPGKVTLLGSSAGAKSIGALMMIDKTNDYVDQVILSSGASQSIRSMDTGTKTTQKFLETAAEVLGYTVTAADLVTLPTDDILRVQKQFVDCPGNTCMFGPVADGFVLPENWEAFAQEGTLWSGNALIGSSRNELWFMEMMNPLLYQSAEAEARGLFGCNAPLAVSAYEKLTACEREKSGCEPTVEFKNKTWVRVFSDYMYRMYSYRLAARLSEKGCKVWQYSVELPPAMHCFDQTLAFEDPSMIFMGNKDGLETAEAVGKVIYESFARFIEYGAPNGKLKDSCKEIPEWLMEWQPLSDEKACQMSWDKNSRVVEIPEDDVLEGFPEGVYRL